MTHPRLGFTNPALRTLHSRMVATGTVTTAGMDRAVRAVDYDRHRVRPVSPSDRILQSHELFEALTGHSNLQSLYRDFAGVSYPWSSDFSAPSQGVLSEFDAMVEEWRQDHPRAGGTSRALAEHIFHWLTDPDGFGMVHDESAPERSFNALVGRRRGDCTEFLYAMMVFYRRAGFSVRPMWVGRDMDGNSNIHVCAQVRVGGREILVDPIFQFDAPHQSTAPLSERELLGWFWNNQALDRSGTQAWQAFERAAQIDPFNAHLYINRADHQYAAGDRSAARRELAQALRLAPNLSPAHERLGNWAWDAGKYSEAGRHYRRALAADPGNLVARDNLIRCLVRLREGRPARAQLLALRERAPRYPHLEALSRLVRSTPP